MANTLAGTSSMEPEEELAKPNNFIKLFNNVDIIRGKVGACTDQQALINFLPFSSIMAIVFSHKYHINTWSKEIVQYVIDTAGELYGKRKANFQVSTVHVIPKIKIGTQAFNANVEVVEEGPTWQLEILITKFLSTFDCGMITTATYSGAFFVKNDLYYLFEGKECDSLGYRYGVVNTKGKRGAACLLRFRKLEDLVNRINYNKSATIEDQHFILSRIIVRKLLVEPRYQLTEDHNFATGRPESAKSRSEAFEKIPATITEPELPKTDLPVGYVPVDGVYRIEGTKVLKGKGISAELKPCHFVSLIAMLMATMHPLSTWNSVMVDLCLEKGLEIAEKADNVEICEKRTIYDICLEGKLINITITKTKVTNKNKNQKFTQCIKTALTKLRYILIRFPEANVAVVRTDKFYNLFDPYPPPPKECLLSDYDRFNQISKRGAAVASWTLYKCSGDLVHRLTISGVNHNMPEFYTFQLNSVKDAPPYATLNYRMSLLFKPDENPNTPYLKRREIYPIVDEKMSWLDITYIPWSRMIPYNDVSLIRNKPETLWRSWDIEFPGDLYSVWGTVHPKNSKFTFQNRGKQYLATCVVALALSRVCQLEAYNSTILDGIVEQGDVYHSACCDRLETNHELKLEDLATEFDLMHPYKFKLKFKEFVFGFLYNVYPDRFNLSKALTYFFESNSIGILMSPTKNLAFGRGKDSASYFMFDCQSFDTPIFKPGKGSAYMLKCESLNRLVYCMIITLNIRKFGSRFHLYSVHGKIKEV